MFAETLQKDKKMVKHNLVNLFFNCFETRNNFIFASCMYQKHTFFLIYFSIIVLRPYSK